MEEYNNHKSIMAELGERIKQYRIAKGMTQQDLESKSGVSTRSIVRLEQGNSVQLESLVKILMALDLAENLDILIPDQRKRPSYFLKNAEKPRQRYRKKKTEEAARNQRKNRNCDNGSDQ